MTRSSFDDLLADYLEDGPTRAPDHLDGSVRRELPHLKQRRRLALVGGRFVDMFQLRAIAVASAVAALAVVGFVAFGPTAPPSAGPGGPASPSRSESPEAVFRGFMDAVNAGDDERAAALLAPGARVFDVAAGEDNVAKVHVLACTADIVTVAVTGDTLDADLRFTGVTPWAPERCDIGESFSLEVQVRDGRITTLGDGG